MSVSICCGTAVATGVGPSVTDIVEFTRLMAPSRSSEEQLREQVSPGGTRAFILTRKANTRTDRNRYELLLLDLRPQRLATGRYEAPVSVASFEPVIDDSSSYPSIADLRWSGHRTIVFRARLLDARFQVFTVDTVTRALTQLTFSPTGVISYAVSDDLRTVLYAAREDNPPMPQGSRSIVVGNRSFWSVMHGQDHAAAQDQKFHYYVAERGKARTPRRLGDKARDLHHPWPLMSLSPDGRWALVPLGEPERQAGWIKDYPLVAEETQRIGPGLVIDPLSYFSRADNYAPMRLQAWRVSDGSARAVVDAPEGSGNGAWTRFLWQQGSRSVVIAGTHLPLSRDAGRDAKGGSPAGSSAVHIVEYWPQSGRIDVLAEMKGRVKSVLVRSGNAFSAVDDGGQREFQRVAGGTWQEIEASASAAAGAAAARGSSAWSLRIRQSLNDPPEVVADGPAGQSVQMTRLNTQVTAAWGSMQPYSWKDAKGRTWDGGLLVPAGIQAGVRRPLVIQTYGFHPSHFYLDGSNESESYTSGFAGRAFLQAGVLVLAMPIYPNKPGPLGWRGALTASMEGVRAAVEALVQEGLVDRERIGIMGWSTTGEWVLNQITFSDVPIRAATMLDGNANTLYSYVVTYAFSDGVIDRKERTNGGMPAGETLARWIRRDPSMHTDCIRAALRIEKYGPVVSNNWDIYALMRRQYKAVEMVVMPKATHALHTPSERMLSLQGNVDWYRFWLSGEERSEPYLLGESDETLREQYRRWRQMAELKVIDDARPACARDSGKP
jgi:dipeptidyl aminopeptidase/acylaminoacyl peptidase